MKTKTKNFSVIAAIVGVLLANIAGFAADTRAERPARPETPANADVTEVKVLVQKFQEQKREFLKMQAEERAKLRSEMGAATRTEASDSITEAKRLSREQARKLATEAKQAAKEGRKRD